MADFYSSTFNNIDPVNPIDYLFREQGARLQLEENERARERFELAKIQNEIDNVRSEEYLKINKERYEREVDRYNREVEGNRRIANIYDEYSKQGKRFDIYGEWGRDLSSALIETGTKEGISKGLQILAERSREADQEAERAASNAEWNRRYSLTHQPKPEEPEKLKLRNIPYKGEKTLAQLDDYGNIRGIFDEDTAQFRSPEELAAVEKETQSDSWGLGELFGFRGEQPSQGAKDTKQLLASNQISPDQAKRQIEYLAKENQLTQPKQEAPLGTGFGLLDSALAGLDEFVGSQAGGISSGVGDLLLNTGIAPETGRSLRETGKRLTDNSKLRRSLYGVDTPAENFVSDVAGIVPSVGKQIGAFALGGPLGLVAANLPEVKNLQDSISDYGGGLLEQNLGGAAQLGINSLGGGLSSAFGAGKGFLVRAGLEGLTEAGQELATIGAVEYPTSLPNPNLQESAQRAGYAGFLGAIGGAVIPNSSGGNPISDSSANQSYSSYAGDGDALKPSLGVMVDSEGVVSRPIELRENKTTITSMEDAFGQRTPPKQSAPHYSSNPIANANPQILIPTLDESLAFSHSDSGLYLPSESVISNISNLHDLSDFYEQKEIGSLQQSIASGGDILPKKLGPFDFSGRKTTASGINTPEVKLDLDVGPVIATDPDGFQLRIPSSPVGKTTRAEIKAHTRDRFRGQRGAIILSQPVAATPAGKFLKQRQNNLEQSSILGIDKYFHSKGGKNPLDDSINGFTQSTTFLTTAAQEWRNQIDNPETSEADRYYAKRAWEASSSLLNQVDTYHSMLNPAVEKVTAFVKQKPEVQRVAATAIRQAQIAAATQPNFNKDAFYRQPIVPVGPNQFRTLTEPELAAIAMHDDATNLIAEQTAQSQIASKKNQIQIERRKIISSLKSLAPRVADLDRIRVQGGQLPTMSAQEQVAIKTLANFDAQVQQKLQVFANEMNGVKEAFKKNPYTPLIRQGKYAVVMKDDSDKQLYFGLFKTPKEQMAHKAILQKANPTMHVKPYVLRDSLSDRAETALGTVSGAISKAEKLANFNELLQTVKSQTQGYNPSDLDTVSKELGDILTSLQNSTEVSGQGFLTNFLPADAIVKTKNKISGQEELVPLPGYEEDPAKALMLYAQKAAFFNAKNITDSDVQAKISQLPESDSKEFLAERLEFAMGRKGEKSGKLTSQARMIHVATTLGFRPSSAIANGMGVILTSYPNISSLNGLRIKKGLPKISPEKEILSASRLAVELGGDRASGVIAKLSKSSNPKTANLARALTRAQKEAAFKFDVSTEWQDLTKSMQSPLEKAANGALFMFQKAEHFANRVAFISHFNALDGVYPSFEEQYQAAKNWMRSINPTNNAANRPKFSRSGVGRMAYTFRGYQGQQLRLWSNWVKQGMKGDPDGMKAVVRAFTSIIGIVGIQGIPFASEIKKSLETYAGIAPKKEIEEQTNEDIADGLFFGALATAIDRAGVPSVTLGGSLGAGEWLPRETDPRKAFSQLALGSYSRYINNAMDAYEAKEPIDKAQKLVGMASPIAERVMQSLRAAGEGSYKNSKGEKLRDRNREVVKPSAMDTITGSLGFAPYRKTKASNESYERRLK